MSLASNFTDPAIAACADLTGRAGAPKFELGFLDDDPINPRRYASAFYQGMRIMVEGYRRAPDAATALAAKILDGGTCRCRKLVTLTGGEGCRWALVGARWEPGYDVEGPLVSGGKRGDYAALRQAMMGENP